MNISHDGVTVRFKTEPEELFEAEKSGAKPNTVRILDAYEADQIKHKPPTEIIIQHQQEIFLRTITHIHFNYNVLGKVIVVISWTNENHHHHTKPNPTGHDPYAHTMSLDQLAAEGCLTTEEPQITLRDGEKVEASVTQEIEEPPLSVQAINVSLSLREKLDKERRDETYDTFISKLLVNYEPSPHQHTMPQNWSSEEGEAIEEEEEEDKKLVLIGISKGMADILVRLAYDRSMDTVIRELYQIYLDKRAEERGPMHD
jgi:hypothetical protein